MQKRNHHDAQLGGRSLLKTRKLTGKFNICFVDKDENDRKMSGMSERSFMNKKYVTNKRQ